MNYENPLIVQGDRSLLLDVHAPLAEECRNALIPFAELEKSPDHLHTYRLTPLSLWNAASAGFSADDAVAVLQKYARYDIPQSVIAWIKETEDRFGKIDYEMEIYMYEEWFDKIARRAGVANANRYISLEGMTDEEVADIAFEYTVFGRVTPVQKKVLVQAFKAQKKTVAMTGDGVNDILALKEADCSIAMASGSDATKYISQLVLLDSNFASMPQVVGSSYRLAGSFAPTGATTKQASYGGGTARAVRSRTPPDMFLPRVPLHTPVTIGRQKHVGSANYLSCGPTPSARNQQKERRNRLKGKCLPKR